MKEANIEIPEITDKYVMLVSPEWFCKRFKKFLGAYEQYKEDKNWDRMCVFWAEFQTDINIIETEDGIPPRVIAYLRDKYI